MKIPNDYEIAYSKSEIIKRVNELGAEVNGWINSIKNDKNISEDVLAIPVLSGAIFFFSDLIRDIEFSVEVTPVTAKSYISNNHQSEVELELGKLRVQGKHVLIIDDICESGRTLEKLKATLEAEGAREVKSAVLISRPQAKTSHIADFSGFEHPNTDWLVGYGMDDNGRYRNLKDIYIKKS